jgi:UDP-glucuronate 4-epimerase
VLRTFTVYDQWGRTDMAHVLFAKAISKGGPIKVFNNGDLDRDFRYIDDIIQGVTRVVDNPIFISPAPNYNKHEVSLYSIYNIGNGTPVELLDFIETIETVLDKKAEKYSFLCNPVM